MKISNTKKKYESEWQRRLDREPNENFWRYERNWVLPSLITPKTNLLDIGSGNSIVGEYAQKKLGCKVVALDISRSAVKAARLRGIKAIVGSVEKKLPFANNSFDVVFWGDNIEHVFNPRQVLSQIYRVLKPRGKIIISTPNQAYWRYRCYTFFTGKLPKTEGEDNQPWEWTHIRFFTRDILRQLLELTGFEEKKFIGISRRKLDRPLLNLFPQLFGMIMVVTAKKQ